MGDEEDDRKATKKRDLCGLYNMKEGRARREARGKGQRFKGASSRMQEIDVQEVQGVRQGIKKRKRGSEIVGGMRASASKKRQGVQCKFAKGKERERRKEEKRKGERESVREMRGETGEGGDASLQEGQGNKRARKRMREFAKQAD